ncbi:hypothetical protein [Microbulbifer aggregans]|uniref:hypothetical protein n=1 Tax=Microbulbifer aggregans TaxID=1769779 RepID=UPI001CFEE2BB|nr:hypothetical protein [Microbulbifer aggregans]
MKKILSVIAGVLLAGSALACNIKSDEKLVCEALICTVGILIPESHSECVKVQTEFAIYLATLGFWEDPPTCKNRDMNCKSTGKASTAVAPSTCDSLAGNSQDFVNCQLQVSKMSGQSFSCSQYSANPTLYDTCLAQFQSNGAVANDDGDYVFDPQNPMNPL